MRLLLRSQTYFIASIVLHMGLFSVLLSSSLHFSPSVDSFDATITFEAPEPLSVKAPVVEEPPPTESTSIEAPKTELKANLGQENTSALPFSIKKIEDLIKRRTSKIDKNKPVEETIVKKKSDLLGYLRATKRTKEAEQKKVDKPVVKEISKSNKSQLEPSSTEKSKEKISIPKPDSKSPDSADKKSQVPPKDSNLFPNYKIRNQNEIAGKSPKPDKKTTALKIWQKKNDTQAYRKVLGQLVKANWKVPPVSIKTFRIVIEATIDPNGNLLKTKLIESSGLAILDAAAERAIRVSTPFPRLPKSIESQSKQYQAVFRFTPDEVIF